MKREKILVIVGVLFILAGIILNPWIISRFSGYSYSLRVDYVRTAIYIFESIMVGWGVMAIVYRKKSFMVNVILLLLVTLVILPLCAEIYIRLNPRLYSEGYRPSKNDKIVYELHPGFTIRLLDAKVSPQGLNDRIFSLEKPADVTRIAIVGDSVSFGWRVGTKNSFPKILEWMLNYKKEANFEVINFSVPGYNTSQELAVIEEKVLKFQPDMVILVYSDNDINLCNYFKPRKTILNFLYNQSCLLRFIFKKIDILVNLHAPFSAKRSWFAFKRDILGMFYHDQIIYGTPGLEVARCIGNPPKNREDVPWRYWYMLGEDNYKVHLSHIESLLKKNGVQFVSSGFFDDNFYNINQSLGITHVCNLYQSMIRKGILWEELALPDDIGHLGAQGHRLVAEYLYDYLKEENLI